MEETTYIKTVTDPVLSTDYTEPVIDYTTTDVVIDQPAPIATDGGLTESTPVDLAAPVQSTSSVATTESSSVQIYGSIFRMKDSEPVTGVKVTLLDANQKPIASATIENNSNQYSVWTDQPATAWVMFEKSGFQTTMYRFSELQQDGSVYLVEGSSKVIIYGAVIAVAVLFFALQKKRKKVGKLTTAEVLPFIVIAAAILGFSLLNKLLVKLGISAGPGTQAAANESSDANSAWKPSYWRQFNTFTYAITTQQAQDYAETIRDAFGLFQDDYNQVFGVFSQMRTKANVSFLADVFYRVYNADMLAFLQDGGGIMPWDGLSETHLKTIIDLVNNLPSH